MDLFTLSPTNQPANLWLFLALLLLLGIFQLIDRENNKNREE